MSASDGSGLATILIVDDELPIAEIIAEVLADEGFETITAAGGEHALQILSASVVHLVLLDLYMPGLSGLDVLARLRAEPAHAELPVIVMTAGTVDSETLVRQGATQVLPKPFEVNALVETVRGLVQ